MKQIENVVAQLWKQTDEYEFHVAFTDGSVEIYSSIDDCEGLLDFLESEGLLVPLYDTPLYEEYCTFATHAEKKPIAEFFKEYGLEKITKIYDL